MKLLIDDFRQSLAYLMVAEKGKSGRALDRGAIEVAASVVGRIDHLCRVPVLSGCGYDASV